MPSRRLTDPVTARPGPLLFAAALAALVSPISFALPDLPQLRSAALAVGLAGDDLSPALDPAARHRLGIAIERPGGGALALYETNPAVRIHHLPASAIDADLDGVPDRAAMALDVAVRTLRFCERAGLGAPADDGDGEIDLYLADLAGTVRGFVVPEERVLPGRGSAGFGVVDVSLRQADGAFRGMVARAVARLVLLGRDANAPMWWLEPSVTWIAARVTGADPDADRLLQARWTYPERGPLVDDPLLARGNVSLLWALRDPKLERRALARSWDALAARDDATPAIEPVEAALMATTGLPLERLVERAVTVQIVSALPPARFTADVQGLPVFDRPGETAVAPLGAALVRLLPDPRQPEGTTVRVSLDDDRFSARLLARLRDGGGWDRLPLDVGDGELTLPLPWNDYDAAVLLFVRARDAAEPGTLSVQATAIGRVGPYALSSFGVRQLPGDLVEVSWTSAWERGLFGWLVERATAPGGPWEPVAGSPVPAVGLPREGTGYSLIDTAPEGAGVLYYRVAAITTQGLRLTAPPIAVHSPR